MRSIRPYWRCTLTYATRLDFHPQAVASRPQLAATRLRDALVLVPRWLVWRRNAGAAPVSVVAPLPAAAD